METVVYALCAITSLLCAVLLGRAYVAARVGLLLWTLLCFVGLALNNIVLFIDKVIVTDVDLSLWRSLPALAGVGALVFGLIWESGRR
jgi:hypothetical protein